MVKISKTTVYLIHILKLFLFCIIMTTNIKSEASELKQNKHDSIYEISFCKSKEIITICINLDKKYNIDINLLNEPYRIV